MRLFILALVSTLFASCVSHEKVTYFNTISDANGGSLSVPPPPQVEFQRSDILEIGISSVSTEAAAYFTQAGSDVDKKYAGNTYQIGADGTIILPLIGAVTVAGKKKEEVEGILREALLEYLQKPSVNVRLASFKITILGEVETPGVYGIPEAQVTIFEALGMAGDLTIYGKRDNVLIVRGTGEQKSYQRISLNDTSIFASEYFYLHNGDLLYVEPSKGITSKDDNAYRILPLVISALTFAVVVIGLTQ